MAAAVAVTAVVVGLGACSSGGDDDEAGAGAGTTSPSTAGAGTTTAGAVTTTDATGEADTAARLYRDPESQVTEWVAGHPDDPRMPAIRDRIAAQPQARWFIEADPSTIADEVRAYVGPAVEAGEVPVLVAYAIPERDCGGASDGGAASLDDWQAWMAGMAEGLGDTRAIVVVEPDALAEEECLDDAQVAARHAALASAVTTLRDADARAEVYLDAGHSDWNPPAEQARRLREAGVLDASGFATNVSNFNTVDDEIAYGRALLDELGRPDLRQVIDVSRNGNGPAPDAEWCDPEGRAVGRTPTLTTGEPTVAAFLWIKPPGEADGCAADPGDFVPDLAYALAGSG
ncbi:MAG TPA: glycoside hydrolase family 6 protein [Acidimicrobiales bacterium]|nr:glycoside hydrolase family 6 protein [Acidimicrobiales bacterium]